MTGFLMVGVSLVDVFLAVLFLLFMLLLTVLINYANHVPVIIATPAAAVFFPLLVITAHHVFFPRITLLT